MSTDLLDLSLDAITEKNKSEYRANRGGRGGGKGRGRGKGRGGKGRGGGRGFNGGAMRQSRGYNARRESPYGGGFRRTVYNDQYEEEDYYEEEEEEEEEEYYDEEEEPVVRGLQTKSARASLSTGTTVQVSNLHENVTEDDMQELFTTPIGNGGAINLKSCCVNYDRDGKCNGTATVVFVRKNDAAAAIQEYNGVPLDGQQMSLAVVGGAIDKPRPVQRQRQQVHRQQVATFVPRARGRGGGRGRGGRGRGRGSTNDRPVRSTVTAEELDGGLDDYFNN